MVLAHNIREKWKQLKEYRKFVAGKGVFDNKQVWGGRDILVSDDAESFFITERYEMARPYHPDLVYVSRYQRKRAVAAGAMKQKGLRAKSASSPKRNSTTTTTTTTTPKIKKKTTEGVVVEEVEDDDVEVVI